LGLPPFPAARRKASASAPSPSGCGGLRGADDVIDFREISRGLPCAGRSREAEYLFRRGLDRQMTDLPVRQIATSHRVIEVDQFATEEMQYF
jgi:hypothetical protein